MGMIMLHWCGVYDLVMLHSRLGMGHGNAALGLSMGLGNAALGLSMRLGNAAFEVGYGAW